MQDSTIKPLQIIDPSLYTACDVKEKPLDFCFEHHSVVVIKAQETERLLLLLLDSQSQAVQGLKGCVNSRRAGRMGSLIWGGNHHNISLSICSLLAMKTTLTLISHLHSLCLTGGTRAA